jgi:predicted secreted Zn-dependent protease
MSQSVSVGLVLALAFLAANLPFLSNRLLALVALPRSKSLAWRMVELVLGYFVVGAIGLFLERQLGQIAPQGWEFYAITATLFLTLAFPGFVFRYLVRHH